ncbi:divalent metal cation transporter [Acidithiobacillus sulfuriphilus]|uniref:divalent metal cation transporter n=1 Tax=Acidithiobacillus sulfuriphilus TaxID=1867749 RepID=UPI003F60509B
MNSGDRLGRIIFGLGILGAAMVASIVVSLAAAWGFGEVTGYKHSLEHHPVDAPWFYLVFTAGVLGGAVLVYSVPDLVALTLGVEVMNALLLPLVLGFLVTLAIGPARRTSPARRVFMAGHRRGRPHGDIGGLRWPEQPAGPVNPR